MLCHQGEAESEERAVCVCASACVARRGLFLPHVQELKGGDPQRLVQRQARTTVYF